jgi:hypothetical protein
LPVHISSRRLINSERYGDVIKDAYQRGVLLKIVSFESGIPLLTAVEREVNSPARVPHGTECRQAKLCRIEDELAVARIGDDVQARTRPIRRIDTVVVDAVGLALERAWSQRSPYAPNNGVTVR